MVISLGKTIIDILELIYSNPGISLVELRKKLNLPPSTATTIIKRLKKLGLIEIVEDRLEIKVAPKGKNEYTRKVKVKKLYPSMLKCADDGTIIVPKIVNTGDQQRVGILVLNCPFVDECPYVNQKTMQPGYCKLYDTLPDKDKEFIDNTIAKIQAIIDYFKNSEKITNINNNK